ncbi:MAG: metallopeptidase family protein [Actinomycetota bacterium]|nr:metallopeptidase family protein [Actinomycetota bacterium]
MIDVAPERFEELVADALDTIPPELARHMDNVWVTVEEGWSPNLLGLYEGIPLTQRDAGYGGMIMPDRIKIFRKAICAICNTEEQVVDQVRETVVHEVAHHFGIDDQRLHELGWG